MTKLRPAAVQLPGADNPKAANHRARPRSRGGTGRPGEDATDLSNRRPARPRSVAIGRRRRAARRPEAKRLRTRRRGLPAGWGRRRGLKSRGNKRRGQPVGDCAGASTSRGQTVNVDL
jgi:hypothetical protein